MTIGALIAALLIAVSLQSRWQHATAAANLELATLQIAALETALESETTLSSASAETMVDRRHGQNISARALLHGSASSSPDSPVAVVIWRDRIFGGYRSGRLLLKHEWICIEFGFKHERPAWLYRDAFPPSRKFAVD